MSAAVSHPTVGALSTSPHRKGTGEVAIRSFFPSSINKGRVGQGEVTNEPWRVSSGIRCKHSVSQHPGLCASSTFPAKLYLKDLVLRRLKRATGRERLRDAFRQLRTRSVVRRRSGQEHFGPRRANLRPWRPLMRELAPYRRREIGSTKTVLSFRNMLQGDVPSSAGAGAA